MSSVSSWLGCISALKVLRRGTQNIRLHCFSFPSKLAFLFSIFVSLLSLPCVSSSSHVPFSHALFFPSSKHLCPFFSPLLIHSIPLLPPSQDGSLVPSGLLRNRQKSIPFPVSITLSFSSPLFIYFQNSYFLPNLDFFSPVPSHS